MKTLTLVLGFLAVSSPTALSQDADTRTVKARTLELQVPTTWRQQETTSGMRAAEFSIPGDPQPAELVVFYFGGSTGGIKANVERWIGQFQQEGLQLKMYQGKCKAGRYIVVDTTGIWNKPDGPPFAQKTKATPDSRALNVIVIEEKDGEEDYYFLKLAGHKTAVSNQTEALRKSIGADLATEKPFELKDADN